MPAPQGSDFIFGYGFEQSDNIWKPSLINKWLPSAKVSGMVGKRPLERISNADSSGQRLKGTNLQVPISPKVEWEPGVDELVGILAHMNGFYSFGAQQGGGTGPYPLTTRPRVPGDSAPATYVDSLVAVASDGDGFPILVSGIRIQDLGYKINAGKFNQFSIAGFGCFDTYTDDASQLVGGAYTGKPIIRGHWDPTKAGPLKLKVTVVAGGGFDGTVKLTTAAYAGATTIQVKFDLWYRVQLDDASRLGINRYEDLWFCIPSTSPGTALAVNQEWSFANARATPVPSYSGRNPLQSAGLDLIVDEGLSSELMIRFHTAEVKRKRPRKPNFTNGSKYSQTTQKGGEWEVSISIDRDREDRSFLKKLIDSTTISVITYGYGDPFGASGFDELWKSTYPNCQVADDMRDVLTKNTLPEKIDLEAARVGSTQTFTDVVNTSYAALP